MPKYKTPGVYVEELSIFPPSVAEVETAVPAFIGYTEKTGKFVDKEFCFNPVKVKSFLEFKELFGGPPPIIKDGKVEVDINNKVISSAIKKSHYLYDSLRLFFDNGGGKCYIICIGDYKKPITLKDFEDGLAALAKKDEPTLILFPDAVNLGNEGELYTLQQAALAQCKKLQDRFAIFDLNEKDNDKSDWEEAVVDFRNKIGMNGLMYGAAYTPWLKTSYGVDIHYRDLWDKTEKVITRIVRNNAPVKFEAKVKVKKDGTEIDVVAGLNNLLDDSINSVPEKIKAVVKDEDEDFKIEDYAAAFVKLSDILVKEKKEVNLVKIFEYLYDYILAVDNLNKTGVLKESKFANANTVIVDSLLYAVAEQVIRHEKKAAELFPGTEEIEEPVEGEGTEDTDVTGDAEESTTQFKAYAKYISDQFSNAKLQELFKAESIEKLTCDDISVGGNTDGDKLVDIAKKLQILNNSCVNIYEQIIQAARVIEKNYEELFMENNPNYKTIITQLQDTMTILPPSGAIAGIYSYVDQNRGVWKTPANVSINSVIGVTKEIDMDENDELNIHVDAGKSINAIKVFTGKGILVWGGRTLAGNDNEWRYISVRRFFNMVEESVKKSTAWAVFEPNDSNTWIKVKSMVSNYLMQKWREGALAGSTPDQAFFVKVGLGITMTRQDILEGRMNVEIGMAVVRPAEFIVLKFSHKMQEA